MAKTIREHGQFLALCVLFAVLVYIWNLFNLPPGGLIGLIMQHEPGEPPAHIFGAAPWMSYVLARAIIDGGSALALTPEIQWFVARISKPVLQTPVAFLFHSIAVQIAISQLTGLERFLFNPAIKPPESVNALPEWFKLACEVVITYVMACWVLWNAWCIFLYAASDFLPRLPQA
jgi:hypothetical protein